MNLEQINQSLKLTIQELVSKLSDEITAKNLIAIQLVERDEELSLLRKEKQELTELLEVQTKPEERKGE
ncbi:MULTISPECIES: hypothetical protein [Streptococcus]|jgi:hypothetical protein|uniref:Uncharacterized protein n=2 Tax=Streptococcus suis TaxID=1307 RepID=A0A345S245_STRSU|nr:MULTISPECIES: hypothetical protein [Streptococcus]ALA07054.1 hypothetical protein phiNJ3_53 [Streptococcus phage phiNJ3]QGJ86197.1 hypothetical protein [Streptococcus phage phi-SsuNJ2_rum]QGJ86258.1 hypothetical protein [Streptococcus phage phi-SsuNJ5_rum]WAX25145.1 hypothetical protein YS387_GM000059 [Streptococcus phage YS387]WAX25579.1 hypothetical protein YS43_GM000052 [Streptococcus phage YS43]